MRMPFAEHSHNFAGSGTSATVRGLRPSFLIALMLLLSASFAHAFIFGMSGDPAAGAFGGQGATGVDRGSALYALDTTGREVLVAKTGDRNSDGFPIDDLGFPSVAE